MPEATIMHPEARQEAELFAATLDRNKPLRILDVGSRDVNGSVRDLFARPPWTYTGVDLESGKGVDIVIKESSHWLPLAPKSYDVAISISVFEHVRRPWEWMRQFSYHVVENGIVYIATHNTWPFHEHPVDCWRVWPDGLREVFKYASIEPLNVYTRGNDTIGIGRVLV